MHYSFVFADTHKIQGAQPLRKLARLRRRFAEANRLGLDLHVYLGQRREALKSQRPAAVKNARREEKRESQRLLETFAQFAA